MNTRFFRTVLALAAFAGCAFPQPDSYSQLREQFANPPAEFRTAPFFVWDGEVSERFIDQYLADYKAQGIGGVFIHPRPGMITPYLDDHWFSLVRYTVERARQLGLQAWLYDENSYPSGFAGGHVPAEMPESYNQGQGLALHKLTQVTPADARKYKVILKKEGTDYRDVTGSLAAEAGTSGEYCGFELTYYPKGPWFAGYSYVDLILPGVTQKFIDVTMSGYQRTVGTEFGKTLPGVFTDEPNINPPTRGSVRWTPDLFAQFEKRWGYDLRPRLLSLFEETGDWQKVRHDYYGLLLDLFIDRWSKPWHAYTEAHNLKWTGHYWEHEWPNPKQGPDNMAMYAWHHVPSIDMLFNQFRETVDAQFGNVRSVKELASVANQVGRRRTLSETYGGAGWELRFEDMKRLGDWEYVLGVNLMNQHLGLGTLTGARKYDYPQSFSYHEPWWPQYHVLADYFGRLSLALSSGRQVNRILVLEPTTSAWMYASAGKPNPRMMEIGRSFQEFVNRLEGLQSEYDLGSENIIRQRGKVANGQFVVGERAYSLVVLPPGTDTLDAATAQLLSDYLEAGGRVLSLVEPPPRIDGAPDGRMAQLAQRYRAQWLRADSPDEVEARRALTTGDFEDVRGKLFHQRRALESGELLFFVNSSLEEPAHATVRVHGPTVNRLDLFTGKVSGYAAGGGRIEVELPPAGSLLVYDGPGPEAPVEPATPPGGRVLAASGKTTVRRLSPNVIQIDYCDLKLGDTVQKDLYFFKAADAAFKYHGFEGNPWNTAVQFKSNILDRNHFPPGSGFEATFYFDVENPGKNLRAVVERPRLWTVTVNGSRVESRPGEWWLDRDFGVYDIGAQVKPGRNAITLAAHPMSVHNELEPVYVLGDFGVTPQPKGWKLTPAPVLELGAWKTQGLPYYSDKVSYTKLYRLQPRSARYRVRLGKWHGTLAEVRVNGKPAGVIASQPYELDVTSAARPGDNRVEVVVYGSLKNLLGPHHGDITRGLSSPWSFRNAPDRMPPGSAYDLDAYGLFEDFEVLAAGDSVK